jgi:DNA-binding transcriptional MerR regulator
MAKRIFTLEEFLQQTGITEETLKQWEKMKMLAPAGTTDGDVSFYSDEQLDVAQRIQQLSGLGYEMAEVQKIIKKVGLPKSAGKQANASPQKFLTVGGLAEQVGVSPRTIKHWEDKGIIEPDTRSDGGFRLYAEHYVFFCKLIKDLQLFGYSLDEIKMISDLFRDFLSIQENLDVYAAADTEQKMDMMLTEIEALFAKIALFKEGIERWESLVKKKKKEIVSLKNQLKKRNNQKQSEGDAHA